MQFDVISRDLAQVGETDERFEGAAAGKMAGKK
jgi:hypothetical protein